MAVAALCVVAAGTPAAQPSQASPSPGDASFSVYLKGTPIGREQVNLARGSSGWIITSTGSTSAPIEFAISRFELKYTPDWQPLELTLEARLRNAVVMLKTSFALTTAINEVTQNSRTVSKEDQISAKTIVLPNNVFGAYEALAARLSTLQAGAELHAYVAPQAEITIKVRWVLSQTLNGPGGAMPTRRYDITFNNPDRPVDGIVVIDERQRLLRFELPAAGLLVVRDDAASVSMRPETVRNPTDADVTIPANGFNLAGTLTTPPGVAGRLRHPAVVLVGGASPADRDLAIDGVPVFGQLAKGLADSGQIVLRYDRRGAGQSGGRTDAATLSDYAEDLRAAIKWLSRRDDVDGRRIVVAGYGDGASAALIAAARGADIDGVVTLQATGARGADVILEQQQRVLDELKLPAAERQARIELQRRIQAAVTRGGGWEGVPEAMRRQADTPWFKSVLLFDPAQVVPKLKQPMLIIHAELDPNIAPGEAERLAALARARRKAPPTEVLRLPGLTSAFSAPGERTVSPKIALAIAEWLKKL